MVKGWPARLTSGEVTLRPLARSDERVWRSARSRNAAWLLPWEATVPPNGDLRPTSYKQLVRSLERQARAGETFPFAVEVDGRFSGQLTVNNIVRASAQFASIGYWLDRDVAGRGVMPRAVAMAIDHCFSTAGLHRIEIAIRPENSNSLRVVEKLGIREIGLRAALPPHRRRLARPPDLRDHGRGVPRGRAVATAPPVTRVDTSSSATHGDAAPAVTPARTYPRHPWT